jgi:hypothetical protein
MQNLHLGFIEANRFLAAVAFILFIDIKLLYCSLQGFISGQSIAKIADNGKKYIQYD